MSERIRIVDQRTLDLLIGLGSALEAERIKNAEELANTLTHLVELSPEGASDGLSVSDLQQIIMVDIQIADGHNPRWQIGFFHRPSETSLVSIKIGDISESKFELKDEGLCNVSVNGLDILEVLKNGVFDDLRRDMLIAMVSISATGIVEEKTKELREKIKKFD